MNNNSKFTEISPSAYSLFETKALTALPFAKESFEIISRSDSTESISNITPSKDLFSISQFNSSQLPVEVVQRIMHFETRYLSIDKGLQDLGSTNIFELASGFSFRGLDLCKNSDIQYVDTDLPAIIEPKKTIIAELIKKYCDYQPTNLNLQSLNALDDKQFLKLSSIFTSGPIAIANEGLLIYFNIEQKEQLCATIHNILTSVGGYWINADIYRQKYNKITSFDKFYKQKDVEFREKNNIENNKFPTFEKAEDFFSRCGFEIYKKIAIDPYELSSIKLINKNKYSLSDILKDENPRETWVLKPI